MKKVMYCVNDVKEKIAAGQQLILAGTEDLLKQLPAGDWIGGSIPYFMAENGGLSSADHIFVTELPSFVTSVTLKKYNAATLSRVYKDAPDNGFSVIIIPSATTTHLTFALNGSSFEGFVTKPLVGWISGVFLQDIGKISPKVFYGKTQEIIEDGAVVMHIGLPAGKYAAVNIINIFRQSEGDFITFPDDGFNASEVFINGTKKNLADYITANSIDTRLPLVADYCGAMINTSFQEVDPVSKKVSFYAPVFSDMEYKLAAPVEDYIAAFNGQMPNHEVERIFFSCNCILNYLYSELEGKQTGGITGPITFGEVAYQLLNQTLVYLTIEDLK